MELKQRECVRLCPPRKPPYVAVGEYMASKALTKKFPKVSDGDDVISGNLAVSLSVAQRDLHYAELRLKSKRHFEKEQKKLLDEQWEELERKEHELRQSFIQFNEFIKENEAKRKRALDQREEQNELERSRSMKIDKMVMEYQELREVKKLVEKKINEYKIYEDFLQKTVDKYPGYFKDIIDIVKKYETLKEAQNYLIQWQQNDVKVIEVEKEKLRVLVNTYHDRVNMLHNKVAQLTQRYETARSDCLKWEHILETVRNETAERMLEMYEVRTICRHLYEEISEKAGYKPIYRGDDKMQLHYIKKALRHLQEVNLKVKDAQETEMLASERPVVSGGSR